MANKASWVHYAKNILRINKVSHTLGEEAEDRESAEFWTRQWMFDRNDVTRARAAAERSSLEQVGL